MRKIIIKADELTVSAILNESKTAQEILARLPFKAEINTWGEEIYFEIPVFAGLENGFSRDIVDPGDLGYWPEGNCFCVFFGPTPISEKGEIRPASKVNLIGKVTGDIKLFQKMKTMKVVEILKE